MFFFCFQSYVAYKDMTTVLCGIGVRMFSKTVQSDCHDAKS